MNIAIDIRALMEKELTGVGEYTLNLLAHLFDQDNTNQYYLFYNSAKKEIALPKFDFENVHYCGFHWPNKLLNFSLVFFKWPKLDKWIERKYKTPKIDFFFFPNISFLATECPYIITAHDISFELFPEFLSLKRKLWHRIISPGKQYAKSSRVIAVSANTKIDLARQYEINPEKIKTIHSGITSNFRPLPDSHPSLKKIKKKYGLPEKFFLFLGTIEPRKNLETLVSSFDLFCRKNKKYSLVVTGKHGWKCKKLLNNINQFNRENENKIILTGFIPNKEKIFLYNLAELFVYPSFYEGFGFPPLEAMACGCPVITSNNSSLTEICRDSAILIDPNNTEDLHKSFEQAIENREFYKRKGIEKATSFNWSETAKKYQLAWRQMNK